MSLFRCGVTRYCPRLKDKEPEQDEPVSGVTGGFEFIGPVIICSLSGNALFVILLYDTGSQIPANVKPIEYITIICCNMGKYFHCLIYNP